MPITAKEYRFCQEYLIDLNGAQAAIRAGYSRHTARQQGSRLLTDADIISTIDEMKAERSEKTGIDAAWLLKRLAEEAEADILDIYGENGELLPVDEWPLVWRQGLVSSIDVEIIRAPDGTEMGIIKKIKVSDRIRRLELIGKHVSVKAFEERVAVTGLDALAERLERAAERMKHGSRDDGQRDNSEAEDVDGGDVGTSPEA